MKSVERRQWTDGQTAADWLGGVQAILKVIETCIFPGVCSRFKVISSQHVHELYFYFCAGLVMDSDRFTSTFVYRFGDGLGLFFSFSRAGRSGLVSVWKKETRIQPVGFSSVSVWEMDSYPCVASATGGKIHTKHIALHSL